MKLTFGRKFIVWLSVTIILVSILVFMGFIAAGALNASVLITYGILITTMGMMYVGGNVWAKWVKSKWFKQELNGK